MAVSSFASLRHYSDREAMSDALYGPSSSARWREHRYVGGPPGDRIKRMQLAHEVRARRAGVRWDMVDLRRVYEQSGGLCGICAQPVGIDIFTIDHIVPLSKRGPHILLNLQIAHRGCNSSKGGR